MVTNMTMYSVLDHVMKQILQVITPVHEDWAIRCQIIDDLQRVAESVESLRGATIEPYGSFVSNLFTRGGDLDISIEFPIGGYISSIGKKRKQMLLRDLFRALRRKAGWHSLQFISNARVPILKLKSSRQSISCDISVDNLKCQIKSKLLLWLNKIDDRFRDMVLLVKEWAKAHDINNSTCGTFNSYSLSLLVIFHFQTCVPAILPPLKDIYTGNIVDDLRGVRADAEKHIAETCDANITRFTSEKFRPVNRSSLSELFISFLAKFSNIRTMASELGICPYTGQWEEIKSNMRWRSKTYAIFVEDPFEQPENTARSVCAVQLPRISEVFQITFCRLTSGHPDLRTLLTELVQPQVAQHIPNTPPGNPGYNGGLSQPRPQVQRSVYSPSQLQYRSQNTGLGSHSYTSSIRPGNTHHGRAQQIWRSRSSNG
ncbi:protein HESO1-like isoform X1 [Quillaja saponaria]|uniref:Protein HESO1-like isoform X1 n=1 Tax=Quillaja saponaria TaxID=32244 RepID=A0AAD7LUK1_QUISA|nr:protein HESO1-like isoform X1 [Quillaja saponaria]KAJ7964567.1 protein HESO1-like isoform X1 [Quillaja saponaria]